MSDDAQTCAKEEAGRHAAGYVEDGMKVGLGTGSTVHFTILELGDRQPDIVCTATSKATEELARSLGLRVVTPDEIGALDIAIDGADEVDPAFNLTKGGGGAHTREKLVGPDVTRASSSWSTSRSSCPHLGPFGTPLEVLDFAPGRRGRPRSRRSGAERAHHPRRAAATTATCSIDAHFGTIADPVALAARLGRRARHRRARHLPGRDGRAGGRRRRRRRPRAGQRPPLTSGPRPPGLPTAAAGHRRHVPSQSRRGSCHR